MNNLKLLLFVLLLGISALQMFGATVNLPSSGIDAAIKNNYSTLDINDSTLYWLSPNDYTALYTATYDDAAGTYKNPFEGSLGIGNGVTLDRAIGSPRNEGGIPAWAGGPLSSPTSEKAGLYVKDGSVNQTGGYVNIVSQGGIGIYMNNGDYNLSGDGDLRVEGSNKYALHIAEGNFNMEGGTAAISGTLYTLNSGIGIKLDKGNFYMKGGEASITGDGSKLGSTEATKGTGVQIEDGNFYMQGGTLDVIAHNVYGYGRGIYITKGDFEMTGGTLNVKDIDSGSRGITVNNGGFNMTGGELNVNVHKTNDALGSAYGILTHGFTMSNSDLNIDLGHVSTKTQEDGAGEANNSVVGIYVYDNGFTQNSGNITLNGSMESNSFQATGYGIYVASGGFKQNDGSTKIDITGGSGDAAFFVGLYVDKDGFLQEDGILNTTASGGSGTGTYSYGVWVNAGGVVQNAGTIHATGNSGSVFGADASGIYVWGGGFKQKSGTIYATGYGSDSASRIYGEGITIYGGSFETNGTIYATGYGDLGNGIYSANSFSQDTAGMLYLMPGTGTSVFTAGAANLKGTLRPAIDFLNNTNGYFYGKKAIAIDRSTASLVPYLVNSVELSKVGASKEILFMTTDAGGLGVAGNAYNEPRQTITMIYGTRISSDTKDYFLTITRKDFVSDVLEGASREVAKFIEDNRERLIREAKNVPIYGQLIKDYSNADMSYTTEDAEEELGIAKLVPDTATKRLNVINENMLDIADSALAQRLTVHNGRTELIPLTDNFRDGFWVTPLGTVMNFYADDKFGHALYSGAGLNVGFAGFLNNNSSYGLGLTYMNGYYNDNNNFGKIDTSSLIGSLGYRTNPGFDKVWAEGMLSYANNSNDAYIEINKEKTDAYRAEIKSGVDIASGSWMFTPALGVDYTYYDYNAPLVKEELVTISQKDTESLRPKAEVAAVYNFRDITRFGIKVGYSMEVLGKGIEQHMELIGDDYVIPLDFKTDRSPRHNGHLALNLNRNISDALSFDCEYGLRVNDAMTTNNFKLNLKLLY